MNLLNALIAKVTKSSVGAAFGVIPAWVWYGVIALVLVMFGGWVNGQRWELKYSKHIAQDVQAIAASITAQSADNTAAAAQYVIVEGKERIKYVERTKEAKDYEKQNQSDAPRTCRANDWVGAEFERLYNGEPGTVSKATN